MDDEIELHPERTYALMPKDKTAREILTKLIEETSHYKLDPTKCKHCQRELDQVLLALKELVEGKKEICLHTTSGNPEKGHECRTCKAINLKVQDIAELFGK